MIILKVQPKQHVDGGEANGLMQGNHSQSYEVGRCEVQNLKRPFISSVSYILNRGFDIPSEGSSGDIEAVSAIDCLLQPSSQSEVVNMELQAYNHSS